MPKQTMTPQQKAHKAIDDAILQVEADTMAKMAYEAVSTSADKAQLSANLDITPRQLAGLVKRGGALLSKKLLSE